MVRSVGDVDWETWEPTTRATLLFVIRDDEVLLIHKKRGIGAGKINGPGGKIDPGETAHGAAVRETQEELLITPTGVARGGRAALPVRRRDRPALPGLHGNRVRR